MHCLQPERIHLLSSEHLFRMWPALRRETSRLLGRERDQRSILMSLVTMTSVTEELRCRKKPALLIRSLDFYQPISFAFTWQTFSANWPLGTIPIVNKIRLEPVFWLVSDVQPLEAVKPRARNEGISFSLPAKPHGQASYS